MSGKQLKQLAISKWHAIVCVCICGEKLCFAVVTQALGHMNLNGCSPEIELELIVLSKRESCLPASPFDTQLDYHYYTIGKLRKKRANSN